jgi:hypothetical protein
MRKLHSIISAIAFVLSAVAFSILFLFMINVLPVTYEPALIMEITLIISVFLWLSTTVIEVIMDKKASVGVK